MDPITLGILYPTFAIAIATARPKWELSSPTESVASYVFAPETLASLPSHKVFSQTEHTLYDAFQPLITNPRESVLAELYRYASLPNNWDGEGAISLSSETVAEAKEFIGKFPENLPLPSPMLSPDGCLGFYWDFPEGYVDIEIGQSGLISVYARSRVPGYPEYFEDNLNWRDRTQNWIGKAFAMLASASVS